MTMFRSLAIRNYRLWFLGALASNIGMWLQATAQDWVVLTMLTDHDAFAVGVTMTLQFGPPLLFVGVSGWVADRFDRRYLLLCTQSGFLALATAIGLLVMTGVMTLPLMYVFAGIFGVITAFDSPARAAIVSDIVSQRDTSNAVALNSASIHIARLAGPAAAGFLIVAVGAGWVFIVNAATFVVLLLMILLMRSDQLQPRVRPVGRIRLAGGFRYVAGRRDLLVVFIVIFIMGAFSINFAIYASTMAIEFGKGADGFGVLSSALAIGSLIGVLLVARQARARLRVILGGTGAFGVTLITSALMPTYLSYALMLVVVGFAMVTVLPTANAYVQTTTHPKVRGRVLAVYMAVVLGSASSGAPVVGWVADTWGPRMAIIVGGVASIIAFTIGAVWTFASRRIRVEIGRRPRFTIDRVASVRGHFMVTPEANELNALAKDSPRNR